MCPRAVVARRRKSSAGKFLQPRDGTPSGPTSTCDIQRVPTSSIQELPDELLSYIFCDATHTEDRLDTILSPIAISFVSRRWRNVALSTSALWTHITLTFPLSLPQLSRALAWLARSRNRPLDILLDFRDPDWDWEEDLHAFRWQTMESVMHLLLPFVSRWREVSMLTDTWAPIFTFLWCTRKVASAPKLESISLTRCNPYFAAHGEVFRPTTMRHPIKLFGGRTLPRLRTLALSGVHVNWATPNLCSLTELELKYHARDVMPSVAEFTALLHACPELVRLAIIGWGPRLTTPPAPADCAAGHCVHLPRLARLELGIIDVEHTIELFALLKVPALRALALEDVAAGLMPGRACDAAPVLEYLASCARGPAAQCVPLATLKTLELRALRARSGAFARLLDACARLGQLALADMDNAVLGVLRPIPWAGAPCAHLETISARRVDVHALVAVVAARAEGGVRTLASLLMSDEDAALLDDFERVALQDAGVAVVILNSDQSM